MINPSALAGAAAPFQGAAAARSTADQPRLAATSTRSGAARTSAAKTPSAKIAAARSSSTGASAPKTSAAKAGTTAQASAAAKTSTSGKTSSSKTGYATIKLPAEFAFLDDPKISIEEKLSRFIGLMMTRSEQRLLAQMEKMAAGATGAADGTSSSGGTSKSSSSSGSSKSGFSLWSLAKALVPPLGLASAVLGDSTVKTLVGEVTGPILAAAATALGLPALAPVALKVGPEVAKLVTSDAAVDLPWLAQGSGAERSAAASTRPEAPTPRPAAPSTGAADPATKAPADPAGATSPKSSSSTSSGSSTTAKVPASEGSTSEKAQLLELQRLQDQDKELFSLFSNMLRAMHDARMTAIQNIR